eukprot:c53238_g1_i1 orf=421-1404(+)
MDAWDIGCRSRFPEEECGDENIVCVTGSWDLLGSWIVRFLLERGYTVRTTIPTAAVEATGFMFCSGAVKRLQLAKVDLLDYRSLSKLFQGCCGVFYAPAPNYNINGIRDYPMEAIDNEVRGVLNVVEACASSRAVKRLVLTSCMSAILWDKHYYSSGVIVDERNWSNLDFCRKEKLWSALSKTLTEKAAWALARDRGLDLVVMNPATVIEPRIKNARSICTCVSSSVALDQSGIFAYMHVDDLAAAHILAFEANQAAGRYVCFERALSKDDIVEAAKQLYPDHTVSQRLESFSPCGLSNMKLLKLGIKFDSNDATDDMIVKLNKVVG